MRYFKPIFWIFLFTVGIGIGFPSCDTPPCNCPSIKGEFFDIEGIQEFSTAQYKGTFITDSDGNQLIGWDELQLTIEFERDFFGYQQKLEERGNDWDFSLFPAAYACSCIENGWSGSKEVIQNFEVLTKNDFDETHPAGSDISDLILLNNFEEEVLLSEYLAREENTPVFFHRIQLYLTQSPTLSFDFGATVRITLDNGEVHMAESEVVFLR